MENDNTLDSIAVNYIRDYAYKNGGHIYDFMDANKIGHSAYGKLMDASAKGKGVIAHRLYGHNLLFDFPVENIHDIAPFLDHLVSDLFTKQGLPIIPGEVLKDVGLLKCCDSIRKSWNFVNGFDILSGTVAIYQGVETFKNHFVSGDSIETIHEVANTLGVGVLELAIAMSTANPFLFIGGILSLTSGLEGLLNDGAIVYFVNRNKTLSLEFSYDALNLETYIKKFRIENEIKDLTVKSAIKDLKFPYKF